jgi:hypothetical protein
VTDFITPALAEIDRLNEQIEELEEVRLNHTGPLVDAATAYYRNDPKTGKKGECAHCFYVFERVRDGRLCFTTDCSWCGPSSSYQLIVRLADLIPYVTETTF